MLLIIAFSDFAEANTARAFMRIGRLWTIAEYDGAEGWGGQYAWPGGRIRYPNANIGEMWGANVRKLGTTAGCTNWTGPDGTTFGYWTSGMYRTYDYDYLPYWVNQTHQTALMPVKQVIVHRWEPPKVVVNGVNITPVVGEDIPMFHNDTLIDPTLVTERAIHSVWRYTMGVQYDRWMYGYSTPNHQDYILNDITFTNNGKMYGLTQDPPDLWPNPDLKQIMENQKITGFWWAQTENPWNSHLGRDKSFGTDDAIGEYIQPFHDAGNNRRFYLFYDGDNISSPEKDWCDPSNVDAVAQGWVELLSPAWIIIGALHVDESAASTTDDLTQPKSTTIFHERNKDLGREPKTMEEQYNTFFTEGNHYVLDTPHNVNNPEIYRPSGYRSYGPYDMNFGETVNLIQVVASSGINHALCEEWGKKAYDANYTGTVMDDIETLHKTGRDSVLKALERANWNVNGIKSGGRTKFNVPDAPRPPAEFTVTKQESKIVLTWSDESRHDKDFDTGVEDFEGYRLYRTIDSRDNKYSIIYDGTNNEYIDIDVSIGQQYFYYLVAYDDGSQNWEDPGVSLESGRWYCWTGWADGIFLSIPIKGNNIPLVYKLGQNYPNPFNPETKIKFSLPENTEIELSVYNVLGKIVTTLVKKRLSAGYYEYKFSGYQLSSGIYYYILKSSKFTKVKKMLLVK